MRLKPLVTALYAGALLTAAPFAQAKELKSIGVTVGDLANPFFVQITKGAELEARKLAGDNVKVTLVSSGYDLGQQVSQIDNFIAANVDMIILNAADSKGIGPAVKRAKDAGIVVVAVDVAAEGADATITSDNTQAGEMACKYITDRLKGKGNVVIINGPPVSAVQNRVEGCQTEFKRHPDIKVLSDNQNAKGSREGGLEVMTGLLAANPKIDGVFAINDPTAIGADLAAKQAQRNEFFIVGVDGSPDAEEALKRENSLFVATPAQDPQVMAAKAVEIGYDILQGKPAPKEPVLIPVTMIDKNNVGNYKGWTVKYAHTPGGAAARSPLRRTLSMKRSAINDILGHTRQFFSQHDVHLPPFASFSPAQWQQLDTAAWEEVFDLKLGWDVTAFGRNNFAAHGLTLFTLRNGSAKGMPYVKCYAEKIMHVRDAQVTPMHFHWRKREDIINRGGGNLIVELWNADSNEQTADSDITVVIDGCRQKHTAGTQLRLSPGESICLPPGLYHSFWAETGFGDVLVGEVSSVNDDDHDNHFLQPLDRYNLIDEDEPAQLVLCNEYRQFR